MQVGVSGGQAVCFGFFTSLFCFPRSFVHPLEERRIALDPGLLNCDCLPFPLRCEYEHPTNLPLPLVGQPTDITTTGHPPFNMPGTSYYVRLITFHFCCALSFVPFRFSLFAICL